MKNPANTTAEYTVTVTVAKSPAVVFQHIINDVSRFWPEEFEGSSSNLFDEFTFRSGDSHYSKNKVIEWIAEKKVVWLVTESLRKPDNFDWTGTKMIFELTPDGNNTLLAFTYDGIIRNDEYERLQQVCDLVIKERLYRFIMEGRRI
ncbi:MAG: hypothetical protein JST09_12305 [Bacteroidetes bacterium]|nr:hypothetical protein [Bacteroidota bacterium]MBS1609968.1 hypothetical protein [Bacteroidota bacterium]